MGEGDLSDSDETRIDLYKLLTDSGMAYESDIVHDHIPAGAEILELGCGTGRMTRRLVELGHLVTAVDISDVMLQHVPAEVKKLRADMETLDLARSFPVVLLASNMVNIGDAACRRRRLASCRRHVSSDGQVVMQRWSPDFDGWDSDTWETRGPIEVRIAAFERAGDEFSATIEYRAGERFWSHSFTAFVLDDAALGAEAEEAGLAWSSTLTDDGTWVELRPAGGTRT